MTTKRHKGTVSRAKRRTSKLRNFVSAEVPKELKDRLTNYCKRPDVSRDASFIQRQALEEFLAAREKEGAK